MKLTITTPLAIVVETDDAAYIRAEDYSGAFGVLRGHADFLTILTISVLTWRDTAGQERHVALRGGMLQIERGEAVMVASPEAVQGDDLHQLESEVLARFRRQLDEERAARTDAQRLHVAAIRRIIRLLRPTQAQSIPSTGGSTGEYGTQ